MMATPTVNGRKSRPSPRIERASEQLSKARRARAEWLYSVATGVVGPMEVVRAACSPDGAPLREMSLRTLLRARYSRRRTDEVFFQLGRMLGVDLSHRYVPVRWLIDARARPSRRLGALALALGEEVLEVPPRFPYEPLRVGDSPSKPSQGLA